MTIQAYIFVSTATTVLGLGLKGWGLGLIRSVSEKIRSILAQQVVKHC